MIHTKQSPSMLKPSSSLAGRRILVIEALSGGAALVREAVEAGVHVTVVTSALADCEMPSDILSSIHHVVTADTTDSKEILKKTNPLHLQEPFDAVFPGCDAFVIAAAEVAAAFGLRGHDVSIVHQLQNKHEMRKALREAGVRAPKFFVARPDSALTGVMDEVGFPAVVKPLNGSGSWHVRRVDSLEELASAIAAIHDDDQMDMGFRAGQDALVESYLEGPEFSVEGFVDAGRSTVVAVTEKILGAEPYFVETGHIVPAQIGESVNAKIEDYIQEVVEAVDLTWGVFHIELRIVSGEPVLIEIGARLGGDQIWELVKTATGVSLASIWLSSAFGISANISEASAMRMANVAAIKFIAPMASGQLIAVNGLAEISSLPGVITTQCTAEAGYDLREEQDFSNRIGFVRCATETVDEMQWLLSEIESLLDVQVMERNEVA